MNKHHLLLKLGDDEEASPSLSTSKVECHFQENLTYHPYSPPSFLPCILGKVKNMHVRVRVSACMCKCTCVAGTGGWSMAVPSTFPQLCFQCDLLHFPPTLVLDLHPLFPDLPLGSLNSSLLQRHSPVGVLQNLYLLPKLQVLS